MGNVMQKAQLFSIFPFQRPLFVIINVDCATVLKTLSLGTEEGKQQKYFRASCTGLLKRLLLFCHHSEGQLFFLSMTVIHVPFQLLINIIC